KKAKYKDEQELREATLSSKGFSLGLGIENFRGLEILHKKSKLLLNTCNLCPSLLLQGLP
ncbi:unnamed protein product, partial [Ilex paraguariensis]